MQICCTKKLQAEIGLAVKHENGKNDLFCWSVHLITINRRKTVVAVNDGNRFGFILYGLKSKDFKNINQLLMNGIRACLRDEDIKDDIINKYIETAGDIIYSKTRGPKYVSRLNKACELVDTLRDLLDPNVLFQSIATRKINHDLIKIDKKSNYAYPHVLLRKDFQEYFQEPVIQCKAVDIIIKLNLGSNSPWRRMIIPIDITFKQLHEILQVAFDWKNDHLYDFNIFDGPRKCILNIISQYEVVYEPRQDCKMLIDSTISLSEYANPQYKINYCYDYGDKWEHEIIILSNLDEYDKNFPFCLMGEGNAPPDDVGGLLGYKEFLEIMADPNHVEYENMRQWAERQGYKNFDIASINRKLRYILR
ncbi:MAG: plasmid pRiA4b ORF-3 family protein [Eubacteriales bacterium]